MGIGPVSCENCSVFKKGEGGPEAPGALRLRNKKATASVASSYSAPSLEADRAPRMFRSINSTSALSLCIWVSVPESGRREGLRNQGG